MLAVLHVVAVGWFAVVVTPVIVAVILWLVGAAVSRWVAQ